MDKNLVRDGIGFGKTASQRFLTFFVGDLAVELGGKDTVKDFFINGARCNPHGQQVFAADIGFGRTPLRHIA